MFNIGQEVVCINPIGDLIKDNIYTIKGATDGCGCVPVYVDVGEVTSTGTLCTDCTAGRILEGPIWWLKANRFTPLISNEELQDELNECIVEEIEFI